MARTTSLFEDVKGFEARAVTGLRNFPIDLIQFNAATSLFRSDANLAFYFQLVNNFHSLKLSTFSSQAIVEKFVVAAFVVLFNFSGTGSGSMKTGSPVAVSKLNSKLLFESLVSRDSKFGLRDLISSLSNMAAFVSFYSNLSEPDAAEPITGIVTSR